MLFKKKHYNRVCYVGTIYTLFLYLMHSSFEEINHTLFLIAPGIPKDVMKRLPCYFELDDKELKKGYIGNLLLPKFQWAWIYHKYIKFKIIIKAGNHPIVYAQDHFDFSATVIGNRPYILIEDSCQIFTSISKAIQQTNDTYFQRIWNYQKLKFYPLYKFLYGDTLYKIMGRNTLCQGVLLSEDDADESISQKEKYICDFNKVWNNAEDKKKTFIKIVYDVTQEDISYISQSDIMVLTQNISASGVISDKEQIEIYRKIVDEYPNKRILFKPHPRDYINYEQYIPGIRVFKKNIPSQLLYLLGAQLQRVATIYSSAVNGAPEKMLVDWYGLEVSPKLVAKLGYCEKPKRAVLKKIKN